MKSSLSRRSASPVRHLVRGIIASIVCTAVLVVLFALIISLFDISDSLIHLVNQLIKIISVGENPRAADSLGVNVIALRYAATLYSGVMFGIAGAYLSIVQGGIFTENMTAGRGFIAMAVVVLGKWHPGGAFLGALLFGASNALQMLLQNSGNNTLGNLILGIPYAATIIAVILVSRSRTAAPSALGTPYVKS